MFPFSRLFAVLAPLAAMALFPFLSVSAQDGPPSGPPMIVPPTPPPSGPPSSPPPGMDRMPQAGDAGPVRGGGRSSGGKLRGMPGTPPPKGESGGAEISDEGVKLTFPSNPVTDILGIYERLTGKAIIKDTGIFEGPNIALDIPNVVPHDVAIQLIETALLTNGYAISPGPDANSIKVLPTRVQGVDQSTFSDGVKLYRDAAALPAGETIASYFMPLSNLDPSQAAEIVSEQVGLKVFGKLTPVTSPPGLLITETANTIRYIIDLKEILDSPDDAAAMITDFVDLVHADANTVAQIIQATLDARAEVESGNPRSFSGTRGRSANSSNERRVPPSQQKQQGQGPQQSGNRNSNPANPVPPAQLVADARLNRIMIIASRDDFDYVTDLIGKFDQPTMADEPLIVPLQFTYAEELLPVIADVLTDAVTTSTQLPGGGSLGGGQQNVQGSNRTRSSIGISSNNSREIDTNETDATGNVDTLSTGEEDYAPISVLVGKTRIIADPRANTVIAYGPAESLTKIKSVIATLDVRQPQVYLATVIGQLQLGDGIQAGFEYLQKFSPFESEDPTTGGLSSGLIGGLTSLGSGAVGDTRTNLISSPFGPSSGFNLYGAIGSGFDAFVTALESTTKFQVLSRPSIYAANNKKAVITSGQRIPVPSSSLTNSNSIDGNANITTNIDYEDVVLKLEVIPLINSNGEVTLTIAQTNDTVVGTQQVGQNSVPIIGTEQLTTTITVPDGETIVLGGLISEEQNDNKSGIPGISKIPILGVPFRNTDKDTTRKELIVFIQPTVVTSHGIQRGASYAEDIRTNIGADAFKTFPPKRPLDPAAQVPQSGFTFPAEQPGGAQPMQEVPTNRDRSGSGFRSEGAKRANPTRR